MHALSGNRASWGKRTKMSNYEKIIKENLKRVYRQQPVSLAQKFPAKQTKDDLLFRAFGESCRITPAGITLGDQAETGPTGIVISLYALQVNTVSCQLAPFKAFRELPNSMPYVNAFAANTERVLTDQIAEIEKRADRIVHKFGGSQKTSEATGDFSFIVYPLPKIGLNYIFYRADDDFPAAVTCLFSHNAASFLPTDALADTGEYTSKKMLSML